ncbi:MAG: hypothetical protein WBE17_16335 [Anaerolineae bacterium]
MNRSETDYDSPWKEILEQYFPEFMAFFFPDAYADIDWQVNHEFMENELRQVIGEAELGVRRVDKLVKVYRLGGKEIWVMVHVEVQSQAEADFAERMYIYNYRLYDRYHRQIASLAVLADETRNWRPTEFGYNLWGCEVGIKFPVVKLLDYRADWVIQLPPELSAAFFHSDGAWRPRQRRDRFALWARRSFCLPIELALMLPATARTWRKIARVERGDPGGGAGAPLSPASRPAHQHAGGSVGVHQPGGDVPALFGEGHGTADAVWGAVRYGKGAAGPS